ncbi:MAG: UTP--glucose-1-phosphate uridylyltransferase [Candidatus Omnitrophota bacterium]
MKDVKFENLAEIDDLFHKAMSFYGFAKQRDTIMMRRVEERIRELGTDRVAVVTGGFHAEPFKEYFESKGYTYARLTPRITKADEAGYKAYIRSIFAQAGELAAAKAGTFEGVQRTDAVIAPHGRGELRAIIQPLAVRQLAVSPKRRAEVRGKAGDVTYESNHLGGLTLRKPGRSDFTDTDDPREIASKFRGMGVDAWVDGTGGVTVSWVDGYGMRHTDSVRAELRDAGPDLQKTSPNSKRVADQVIAILKNADAKVIQREDAPANTWTVEVLLFDPEIAGERLRHFGLRWSPEANRVRIGDYAGVFGPLDTNYEVTEPQTVTALITLIRAKLGRAEVRKASPRAELRTATTLSAKNRKEVARVAQAITDAIRAEFAKRKAHQAAFDDSEERVTKITRIMGNRWLLVVLGIMIGGDEFNAWKKIVAEERVRIEEVGTRREPQAKDNVDILEAALTAVEKSEAVRRRAEARGHITFPVEIPYSVWLTAEEGKELLRQLLPGGTAGWSIVDYDPTLDSGSRYVSDVLARPMQPEDFFMIDSGTREIFFVAPSTFDSQRLRPSDARLKDGVRRGDLAELLALAQPPARRVEAAKQAIAEKLDSLPLANARIIVTHAEKISQGLLQKKKSWEETGAYLLRTVFEAMVRADRNGTNPRLFTKELLSDPANRQTANEIVGMILYPAGGITARDPKELQQLWSYLRGPYLDERAGVRKILRRAEARTAQATKIVLVVALTGAMSLASALAEYMKTADNEYPVQILRSGNLAYAVMSLTETMFTGDDSNQIPHTALSAQFQTSTNNNDWTTVIDGIQPGDTGAYLMPTATLPRTFVRLTVTYDDATPPPAPAQAPAPAMAVQSAETSSESASVPVIQSQDAASSVKSTEGVKPAAIVKKTLPANGIITKIAPSLRDPGMGEVTVQFKKAGTYHAFTIDANGVKKYHQTGVTVRSKDRLRKFQIPASDLTEGTQVIVRPDITLAEFNASLLKRLEQDGIDPAAFARGLPKGKAFSKLPAGTRLLLEDAYTTTRGHLDIPNAAAFFYNANSKNIAAELSKPRAELRSDAQDKTVLGAASSTEKPKKLDWRELSTAKILGMKGHQRTQRQARVPAHVRVNGFHRRAETRISDAEWSEKWKDWHSRLTAEGASEGGADFKVIQEVDALLAELQQEVARLDREEQDAVDMADRWHDYYAGMDRSLVDVTRERDLARTRIAQLEAFKTSLRAEARVATQRAETREVTVEAFVDELLLQPNVDAVSLLDELTEPILDNNKEEGSITAVRAAYEAVAQREGEEIVKVEEFFLMNFAAIRLDIASRAETRLEMAPGTEWVTLSAEELAKEHKAGTNGFRGDNIGLESQLRITNGTAAVLAEKWQTEHPGEEMPWVIVGFDPRPQGVNGFEPGEMGESKASAEVLAAYGFKVLFVPKPVAAPFMISATGKGVHPRDIFAAVMRTASHNEVVDPKSGELVSGLKIFWENAPAPETMTNSIGAKVNDRAFAAKVPLLDFDRAVREGRIVVVKDGDADDPDTVEFNRVNRAFNLAAIGEQFRAKYPDFKIALNTMHGGMSSFAVRVLKAMGFVEGRDFQAFNTALMNDARVKDKMLGWIDYTTSAGEQKRARFSPDPTKAHMRGQDYKDFVATDPAHIVAILIDGDADRLVAELKEEIVPNEIGMAVGYFLAKYKGQTGRIMRTVPTTGGLDALAQALELGSMTVTPVGSKWFAGPNQYYDATLNDILVAVEESGHIGFRKNGELFFDHSIGLAVQMLEIMAETGKTWQEFLDETWAFVKEKTGQERITAVRYGIPKEDGAEDYYELLAHLGSPAGEDFRREFAAEFETRLTTEGMPWKVTDFDITDNGGSQFIFEGGRKLFPRKSGSDGSIRLYVEVLAAEKDKAPSLAKIMKETMDHFKARFPKEKRAEVRVVEETVEIPEGGAGVEMLAMLAQHAFDKLAGHGTPIVFDVDWAGPTPGVLGQAFDDVETFIHTLGTWGAKPEHVTRLVLKTYPEQHEDVNFEDEGDGGAEDGFTGLPHLDRDSPELRAEVRVQLSDLINPSRLSAAQRGVFDILLELGQEHLFEKWSPAGQDEDRKIGFFDQVLEIENTYPGGLRGYHQTVMDKIEEAKNESNPFIGWHPSVPSAGKKYDVLGNMEEYLRAEAKGLEWVNKTGFVLVAGGMGQRLGYKGIKVEIPLSLLDEKAYLQRYIESILALQALSNKVTGENRRIPLAIMTSDETDERTRELLEENNYFGMDRDEVILVKQPQVPLVADMKGRFLSYEGEVVDASGNTVLDAAGKPVIETDVYRLNTGPHGHGDVHTVLRKAGVITRWKNAGTRYTVFFQDTNGQVFNAVLPALAHSVEAGLAMNSVTVQRKPGDDVGLIMDMEREGVHRVQNVEYNYAKPVLKEVSGQGDIADETGNSPYPGNINVLVLDNEVYEPLLREHKSQGWVRELFNPKRASPDSEKFTKPARVENNMQDVVYLLYDMLGPDAKIGFTDFTRDFVFSAVKNNWANGRAKVEKKAYPEVLLTAESHFYWANRLIFRHAGVRLSVEGEEREHQGIPFSEGAKIALSADFAPTVAETLRKVHGGSISDRSALLIEGKEVYLNGLELDGTLRIYVGPGVKLTVNGSKISSAGGWKTIFLPEELPAISAGGETHETTIGYPDQVQRMRGAYMIKHRDGTAEIDITKPGEYVLDENGQLHTVSRAELRMGEESSKALTGAEALKQAAVEKPLITAVRRAALLTAILTGVVSFWTLNWVAVAVFSAASLLAVAMQIVRDIRSQEPGKLRARFGIARKMLPLTGLRGSLMKLLSRAPTDFSLAQVWHLAGILQAKVRNQVSVDTIIGAMEDLRAIVVQHPKSLVAASSKAQRAAFLGRADEGRHQQISPLASLVIQIFENADGAYGIARGLGILKSTAWADQPLYIAALGARMSHRNGRTIVKGRAEVRNGVAELAKANDLKNNLLQLASMNGAMIQRLMQGDSSLTASDRASAETMKQSLLHNWSDLILHLLTEGRKMLVADGTDRILDEALRDSTVRAIAMEHLNIHTDPLEWRALGRAVSWGDGPEGIISRSSAAQLQTLIGKIRSEAERARGRETGQGIDALLMAMRDIEAMLMRTGRTTSPLPEAIRIAISKPVVLGEEGPKDEPRAELRESESEGVWFEKTEMPAASAEGIWVEEPSAEEEPVYTSEGEMPGADLKGLRAEARALPARFLGDYLAAPAHRHHVVLIDWNYQNSVYTAEFRTNGDLSFAIRIDEPEQLLTLSARNADVERVLGAKALTLRGAEGARFLELFADEFEQFIQVAKHRALFPKGKDPAGQQPHYHFGLMRRIAEDFYAIRAELRVLPTRFVEDRKEMDRKFWRNLFGVHSLVLFGVVAVDRIFGVPFGASKNDPFTTFVAVAGFVGVMLIWGIPWVLRSRRTVSDPTKEPRAELRLATPETRFLADYLQAVSHRNHVVLIDWDYRGGVYTANFRTSGDASFSIRLETDAGRLTLRADNEQVAETLGTRNLALVGEPAARFARQLAEELEQFISIAVQSEIYPQGKDRAGQEPAYHVALLREFAGKARSERAEVRGDREEILALSREEVVKYLDGMVTRDDQGAVLENKLKRVRYQGLIFELPGSFERYLEKEKAPEYDLLREGSVVTVTPNGIPVSRFEGLRFQLGLVPNVRHVEDFLKTRVSNLWVEDMGHGYLNIQAIESGRPWRFIFEFQRTPSGKQFWLRVYQSKKTWRGRVISEELSWLTAEQTNTVLDLLIDRTKDRSIAFGPTESPTYGAMVDLLRGTLEKMKIRAELRDAKPAPSEAEVFVKDMYTAFRAAKRSDVSRAAILLFLPEGYGFKRTSEPGQLKVGIAEKNGSVPGRLTERSVESLFGNLESPGWEPDLLQIVEGLPKGLTLRRVEDSDYPTIKPRLDKLRIGLKELSGQHIFELVLPEAEAPRAELRAAVNIVVAEYRGRVYPMGVFLEPSEARMLSIQQRTIRERSHFNVGALLLDTSFRAEIEGALEISLNRALTSQDQEAITRALEIAREFTQIKEQRVIQHQAMEAVLKGAGERGIAERMETIAKQILQLAVMNRNFFVEVGTEELERADRQALVKMVGRAIRDSGAAGRFDPEQFSTLILAANPSVVVTEDVTRAQSAAGVKVFDPVRNAQGIHDAKIGELTIPIAAMLLTEAVVQGIDRTRDGAYRASDLTTALAFSLVMRMAAEHATSIAA